MNPVQFGDLVRTDLAAITATYRRDSIVRIANFLPSAAAMELHGMLRDCSDWRRIMNSGDKVFEFDRAAYTSMDAANAAKLNEAVYAGARDGFQYRYETIRVPDEPKLRDSEHCFTRFAKWMSTGTARDFFRAVTGDCNIAFADAQMTAFSPGDFLTGHDDAVAGKRRVAAYTLGLTPRWRPEWGGLLLLHGDEESPARAYPPMMNMLTLFKVPQLHSVSEVTRAAAYRRYSITGWLRC